MKAICATVLELALASLATYVIIVYVPGTLSARERCKAVPILDGSVL